MSNMIDNLGGPTLVARMVGCKVPSVVEWRRRGIPAERCPDIERAMAGSVTVEQLRPDIRWVRIGDSEWPHPKGRPCLDVASMPAVNASSGVGLGGDGGAHAASVGHPPADGIANAGGKPASIIKADQA